MCACNRELTVRICILVLSLALTGCVSTKTIPLQGESIAARHGGTITASVREKPDFSAMTAGKAMFGMIGAAAMISAGNEIVRTNGVEDPAVVIGDRLMADLAAAHSLNVKARSNAIAATNEPDKLASLYPETDLLLDVQTVNWSTVYFPTDWNSYRVIYSVKLRLLDTHKGKMVAEGFCARVPEKSDDAPGYDELLADNAAVLKRELAIATDYCVGELRSKVLSLPPATAAASLPGAER